MMDPIEWKSVFLPSVPMLEIVIRGSVMYLGLFVLLRIILKRQSGTLGVSDLLLITLLADASQNGMAGEYKSLSDGLLLVATIIFWNYALDWLSFQSAWFSRLVEPAPLPLVQRGKLLYQNMRRELITEDDLRGQLREQDIDDISRIKEARIESDGRISVVPFEGSHHAPRQSR